MEADRPTGGESHPHRATPWTPLSFLLSGFLLFGGIGWGLDALLGTRCVHAVGLLSGGAASCT